MAHTAFMLHRRLRRGHSCMCSTHGMAALALWPALSPPPPSPSCMVLPTPSTVVGMEPVGIAWDPKEVSSWKMGSIHFVVWPNNFLSCQFIEK